MFSLYPKWWRYIHKFIAKTNKILVLTSEFKRVITIPRIFSYTGWGGGGGHFHFSRYIFNQGSIGSEVNRFFCVLLTSHFLDIIQGIVDRVFVAIGR